MGAECMSEGIQRSELIALWLSCWKLAQAANLLNSRCSHSACKRTAIPAVYGGVTASVEIYFAEFLPRKSSPEPSERVKSYVPVK